MHNKGIYRRRAVGNHVSVLISIKNELITPSSFENRILRVVVLS